MANPMPPFSPMLAQMRRLSPYIPRSHGIPRVDDRRVLSGIIDVIRHGPQWRDAPPACGPHKTLDNRFVRWSRMGVFDMSVAAGLLVAKAGLHPLGVAAAARPSRLALAPRVAGLACAACAGPGPVAAAGGLVA
jgi:hypothetical protein